MKRLSISLASPKAVRHYACLLVAAIFTLLSTHTISAQQLPNNGFEDWTDCKPWTSDGNETLFGKTPVSWTISHVYATQGSFASTARTNLGESTTGKDNNGYAVYIHNEGVLSKGIPGYFTLGTTWSTSIKTGTNKIGRAHV